MDRWRGKVAVVSGGGGGMGSATVQNLLAENVKVVAIDNSKERLSALPLHQNLRTFLAEISNPQQVSAIFAQITNEVGPVHILVNAAGVMKPSDLINGNIQMWKETLDTNVLGLSLMTREAINIMLEHNIDGHIVHFNSVWGHEICDAENVGMYYASKYAITALTETLRRELSKRHLKIKISSVSPGKVDTDFAINNGYPEIRDVSHLPGLSAKDVADSVLYILGTPPHVIIQDLMIRPVGESNVF